MSLVMSLVGAIVSCALAVSSSDTAGVRSWPSSHSGLLAWSRTALLVSGSDSGV